MYIGISLLLFACVIAVLRNSLLLSYRLYYFKKSLKNLEPGKSAKLDLSSLNLNHERIIKNLKSYCDENNIKYVETDDKLVINPPARPVERKIFYWRAEEKCGRCDEISIMDDMEECEGCYKWFCAKNKCLKIIDECECTKECKQLCSDCMKVCKCELNEECKCRKLIIHNNKYV